MIDLDGKLLLRDLPPYSFQEVSQQRQDLHVHTEVGLSAFGAENFEMFYF